MSEFSAASYIREIGRGKQGARSLSQDDAARLYEAMLTRQISDLELGAVLLAMRIKGESAAELAGFMQAAHAQTQVFALPDGTEYAPVLIPSYNGARKKINLTPLLAGLLAQRGVPVLVHGVKQDKGRVSSAEIFQELAWPCIQNVGQFNACLKQFKPAFIAIDDLAPNLAGLLRLRAILGVRNSTHTVVKLLQVFAGPALRLFSYTHPEYLQLMREFLPLHLNPNLGEVLVMRATEGEVVVNVERAQQIERFHNQSVELLAAKQSQMTEADLGLPDSIDATSSAEWMQAVMQGKIAVPENLQIQLELCQQQARRLRQLSEKD